MRCTNKVKKATALILALSCAAGLPVGAAEPAVSVDESVYVNLDYYGRVEDTNIVKGCDLNGNTVFTDYGSYDTVVNMSNHVEPELLADHVTWKLDEGETGRFYYECKPKNTQMLLPWSIDVSYSLNGVPVKAEETAGASGIVQIDVKVTPNGEAAEYYRNNMMLVSAMLVDLEDVDSFRADGAQMQSVGSQKAALFVATPGEETDFTYQIGSKSFETTGVMFLMIPAKFSQLDEVKNIKDAKERIQDAYDALNVSLDIVFDSIGSLSSGLRETQAGLDKLNQAREVIHESTEGLYKQNDKAMAAMKGLSTTLRKLGRDVEDSQDALESLSDRLDSTADSMTSASNALKQINAKLRALKDAVESGDGGRVTAIAGDLLSMLGTKYPDLYESLQEEIAQLMAELEAAIAAGNQEEIVKTMNQILAAVEVAGGGLSDIASTGDGIISSIHDLTESLADSGLTSSASRALASTAYLMDNIHNLDSYIQSTVQDCEELLNAGTEQTLDGLQSVLGNTANGTDQSAALRQHKDTIYNTIEDEWNRLEDDLGILDIDVDADLRSFTSDKNPTPDSIQIILRTAEISTEEDTTEVDMEKAEQDVGAWQRIANIFIKIWNALVSIFQ